MTKTVKNIVAQARVRKDVREYFKALSGHGALDIEMIAEGSKDAADHAESMISGYADRGIDLAQKHDLDAESLCIALEAECAEEIAGAISAWAPLDAAQRLAKEIRVLSDEEAEELDDYIDDGFPVSFEVELDGHRIIEVRAELGNVQGYEWQGTSKTLDELRAMPDGDLVWVFLHGIHVAIENHRDQIAG